MHRDGNPKEHGRGATRILALRPPRLYSLLKARNNGFCNHGKNVHLSLVGKIDDGTFKTNCKKTHPPSMCSAIATAMWDAINTAFNSEAEDPPEIPATTDFHDAVIRKLHVPWSDHEQF
eukprot:2696318-Pyramimonas_sp.AAC.1